MMPSHGNHFQQTEWPAALPEVGFLQIYGFWARPSVWTFIPKYVLWPDLLLWPLRLHSTIIICYKVSAFSYCRELDAPIFSAPRTLYRSCTNIVQCATCLPQWAVNIHKAATQSYFYWYLQPLAECLAHSIVYLLKDWMLFSIWKCKVLYIS